MTPFLEQVARHYFRGGDISGRCFIFPNRRSMAFFMKYLGICAAESRTAFAAPQIYTMNDFFYRATGFGETSRTALMLELYGCYEQCCRDARQQPDPLDEFVFWGDILMSDFDDVDKYLADPSRIFTNISEFRAIDSGFDWIENEAQRAAVEALIGHFKGPSISSGGTKDRFMRLWDMMYPIYKSFNSVLRSKGMAYEGMAYRALAAVGDGIADLMAGKFKGCSSFVFVGLNALNGCEKKVMTSMRRAGIARFCWDFSSEIIHDPANQASKFMAGNLADYPQDFPLDPGGLPLPEISVVSVPSSTGQASIASSLLEKLIAGGGEGSQPDWQRTAIVLPDENLLLPLLNSIPSGIRDINVTMGYPMGGSSFFALMSQIALLQLHMRKTRGEWTFYHRYVRAILSNDVFRTVASDDGLTRQIFQDSKFYVPESDFVSNPLFKAVFRPVVLDPKSTEASQIQQFGLYLKGLCLRFAVALKEFKAKELELTFAKAFYIAIKDLCERPLAILPATFVRLLKQLLAPVSVPFEGEPLRGLQIMGPLETRALDFDNIILLSANEGIFPHKSIESSFIPPELRAGFDLPTYEHQDRVWAYYFYRLIQRARNVWMICDSRADGLKTGEESRYIKQLEFQYHDRFGIRMQRYVATASIRVAPLEDIAKTEEDVALIRQKGLSATSLESYLTCPAKFYYQKVKGLKAENEVAESLDGGMIGTIFHKVMQDIFMNGSSTDRVFVSRADLEKWTRRGKEIRSMVSALIEEKMKSPQVSGRDLVTRSLIERYVLETLKCDIKILDSSGAKGFEVFGLEKEGSWTRKGFRFYGFIDRVDSFIPGVLRVVDYKTGTVLDGEKHMADASAARKVVEALFAKDTKDGKRPKIAIQMFLYDRFMENSGYHGKLDNTVYHMVSLPSTGVVSMFGEGAREVFDEGITSGLDSLLDEIASTQVGFSHATDTDSCRFCDFKNICGR
ncbi:MAG: PD-(D/E)XK nuclease family protein [Bacteroidales bacterium]|nr:PD-(D/E)XK nuclease family protein [Bacteroidales bacterium]